MKAVDIIVDIAVDIIVDIIVDMYRPAGGRVVVKVLGDGVAGGVPGQPALAVPVILVRRTEHIRAWHRYVDIDM